MPELPEVETTVRDLRAKVLKRTFVDAWADFEKMIKRPSFKVFKKEIIGKEIKGLRRRGKNILFDLSQEKTLLIHQKLTGHLLFGQWKSKKGKWLTSSPALQEKYNSYIHLLFKLDNGKMIALSDVRKFAKVELWNSKDLENSEGMRKLGPEPLDKEFTFKKFKEVLPQKGKIKSVLMNQNIVVGIGNIYSDEVLFAAKVSPLRDISDLSESELKKIYLAIPRILKKAISLRGESIIDWRDPQGKKGFFDSSRKVYRREGENCFNCGGKIKRVKIGGRSAHYCPKCQK